MVKYVVLYEGKPQDPEEFNRYYWDKHLPTVARWPNIKRIVVSRARLGGDLYQLCEFFFDSLEDLQNALASPERKISGEDRKNFPPFEGTIRHQAVEIEEYW
jgi:uncharacterized protein (TIGR02118 family)